MGQMQGDPKMTVEDNVQACQVIQNFVAVHGGFGECKALLESMGIPYTAVTVQGRACMVPAIVTAQSMAACRLAHLGTSLDYQGGVVFSNIMQEPEVVRIVKNLQYPQLLSIYQNRYLMAPAFQRRKQAVDPDASAKRLRKLNQTLAIEGAEATPPGEAAYRALYAAVGCDDGPADESVSESRPAVPDVQSGGNSGASIVASAIPADVMAMSMPEAKDHYTRLLGDAVTSGNAFKVFDALAWFARVAHHPQRLVGDKRPLLTPLHAEISQLLAGTRLSDLLTRRPPQPAAKGKQAYPESLAVQDKLAHAAAQAVCRTQGGDGGLVQPDSLSRVQRAVVDFCLTRFMSPKRMTRWPETLFV